MRTNRRVLALLFVSACLGPVGPACSASADSLQASTGTASAVPADKGLRLSGIVAIGGEPLLAVIEAAGRGARVVRAGDRLKGGFLVLELGPDWVRLGRNGEEQMLEVSSSSAGTSAESAPQRDALGGQEQALTPEMGSHGPILVGDELKEVIAGVASDERASTQDLAFAVAGYLGLPADLEISVTDLDFGELENAQAVKQLLDDKSLVRMRLSDADGEHMLYLKAEEEAQPTEGAE